MSLQRVASPHSVLLGWKGEALWLWSGMNPSLRTPTAPARLLCEPELSSAQIKTPLRSTWGFFHQNKNWASALGNLGKSLLTFSLVWPQRVGVTCPGLDTRERHAPRWVRGTQREARCLLEMLKAAQRAGGFVLSKIQVDPKVPKPRDDRHASQLNVLILPCCVLPSHEQKASLPPGRWASVLTQAGYCTQVLCWRWMTLLSFGVSFASPLPGVGGNTKRQISQEAGLAVWGQQQHPGKKVWAWDNLKSPGRWWVSHFGEFPFGSLLNNLWSYTQDSGAFY